jgi:glycosyltransferase involved in cell wall biosynthesis
MKIVFIDPKCPSPYDGEALRTRGLGGTEATVVRIAQGLQKNHVVQVVQHNRETACHEGENLAFLPLHMLQSATADADHIFFIQKAQYIEIAAQSKARLWLWLHNFLGEEVPYFWQDHVRYKLGIVCVSRTHAQHTQRYLHGFLGYRLSMGWMARGGLLYLHNPIDDGVVPNAQTMRDKNKLVFFSSPYKGLDQVLESFKLLHARSPSLRLYVADPGYATKFDMKLLDIPGVVKLGTLSHAAVMQHVREALCVFAPQRKRPETFGLVYAESNAVGTPVLAHRFGAAQEVLCEANPPLDTSNTQDVIQTVLQWAESGGPAVQVRGIFRQTHVVATWQKFLQSPAAFAAAQSQDIKAAPGS